MFNAIGMVMNYQNSYGCDTMIHLRPVALPQVGQCGNQIGCRFWDLAICRHSCNRSGGSLAPPVFIGYVGCYWDSTCLWYYSILKHTNTYQYNMLEFYYHNTYLPYSSSA